MLRGMDPKDTVFCSLFAYAYCKTAGERWEELHKRDLENPEGSHWPGFHTVGQLRRVGPCTVLCDGSTLITKARSRAAGMFLRRDPPEDVWISVDDDVFADAGVLERLIRATRETHAVVFVPYVLRSGKSISFEFETLDKSRVEQRASDLALYPVDRGIGFGLTAVHRDIVEELALTVPWVKKDASLAIDPFPALFLESVEDGEWIGEDCSFARRCHLCNIPVYALLDAPCQHGKHWMMLSADLELFVTSGETARTLSGEHAPPFSRSR